MQPTLVILAAGIGRRYGGLKQLEAVGPGGATIMDYSIYDAIRAGFGKVVFVIRREMEAAVRESLGRRYAPHIPVAYAFQELTPLPPGVSVPPGRTKPWGTSQAVLAAADVVHEPLAVVNADDFYGADAFATLSSFLAQQDAGVPIYALVAYRLRDTLSDHGAVSRGICRTTPDGWLESITETIGIERAGPDGRYRDQHGQPQVIPGDTLVSMNAWAFTPAVFEQLRAGFVRFLHEHAASDDAEFYLPLAIQELLRGGHARVKVLPSTGTWCGVTHPQDKQRVADMLRQLTEQGEYPQDLWA